MADVELSSRAADWLDDAEPDVREQVFGRLEQAAEFPNHFLTGLTNLTLQAQSRDYRCLVDWRRDDGVLFVQEIGHRRNIYD